MRATHLLLLWATRITIPDSDSDRPASRGIKCEWDVPDDVFMLLVLGQAKMEGVSGLAKYRDEFSSVS